MIDFKFPRKREIYIIEQVVKKDEAGKKADENKESVIGGIARVISRKTPDWVIDDYFLKYEPFWHLIGESFFEYMRRSQYNVDVKPEVRSISIGNVIVEVDGDKPIAVISGKEHCFERYDHEILVSACTHGKSNGALKPYMEAKSKPVSGISALTKSDTNFIPVDTRASFLVTEMIKQLLKPIQADRVIREKVAIKKLTLYFRPTHVFNYRDKTTGKMRTVEVDAVTGEVHRPNFVVQKLRQAAPTEDTLFDVGGFAESVIPGAGLGAFIGKNVMKYRRRKKARQAMESSKAAAGKKRKSRI